MTKQRKRWDIYIIGWDNGPTYKLVKSTSRHWPAKIFQRLADRTGFDRLKRDTTLIGGHFMNSQTGDCLICVPHGIGPEYRAGVCYE